MVENRKLNNLGENELSVSLGSIDLLANQLKGTTVDLLVCNILAPAIKKLSPYFAHITSKESQILLSGLLEEQVEDMTAFLSILSWKLIASYKRDNWSLIHLCKAKVLMHALISSAYQCVHLHCLIVIYNNFKPHLTQYSVKRVHLEVIIFTSNSKTSPLFISHGFL